MTPHGFVAKWRHVELKERTASQSHFNDLCALLGVVDPITADPAGDWFTFEKGATKTGGGEGWADVWRKECFAWEYKGPRKDLDKAFEQLLQYSVALENPPLLIVSDMDRIRIHTNWTNTVQEVHEFTLADLEDGEVRDRLKAAFIDPEAFKPTKTRQALTEETAREFAAIAQRLRERGHEAHQVAHFVNQLVFCMFAEDVSLLPDHLFTKMLEVSRRDPAGFAENCSTLFGAMANQNGKVGFTAIDWFNGGLFTDDHVLPVSVEDIDDLLTAARRDWSQIDPSILGTLFERGLDPAKRSQLGAHYTDRAKIMMIVQPVIIEPLEAEWAEALAQMTALVDKAPERTAEKLLSPAERGKRTRILAEAKGVHTAFIDKLAKFRVLDPACGSGNFLYVALKALKDIEHRANLDAEALGLARGFPKVGPESVLGIELNPYAAELARVSVWIGEIQWMRRNGFDAAKNPILRPLDTIQQRDAIVNPDCSATEWPEADVIIGNPPFLGAKLMKRMLGVVETDAIRALYDGRLPGFTDLVCYWFENARSQIEQGKTRRAGLVATNSIRKNTNLPVLRRITATSTIFEAWNEEKWTIDGAAVDVSLICFGCADRTPKLNGAKVGIINPDLTTGLDLTKTADLAENASGAFLGVQKSGPFDIAGATARKWLAEPLNPNRQPNSAVLRPYWNGDDVTARPRDVWLIDLPLGLSGPEASQFATPFEYIRTTPDDDGKIIQELRADLGERAGPRWWEQHWPRPEMRARIAPLRRYIVTPETAQHRMFVWLSLPTLPDKNLIVIPRDDDTSFGILHSRFHELWALRKGSDLQDRPRYTHTSVFATFPFPEGLTPNIPAADYADDPRAQAIAAAAARLNELRENWLNPADLVVRRPEVLPGYPDRILPRDEEAGKELKKRTLTNLYNARPQWLANAHADLAAMTVAQGTDMAYDADGRKLRETLTGGGTTYALTQYSYDAEGRLTCAAQRMDPAQWAGQTDACVPQTNGPNGPDRITKSLRDSNGRVTTVQVALGTAAQADERTLAYSANGVLTHLIDANLNRTTYEVDGHDRLVKTRMPLAALGSNSSSTTDFEQLTLDPNGNVTSRIVRGGQVIGYSYDALNRLTAKDLPAGESDIGYGYDLANRLTTVTMPGLAGSMTWDALGRMTSEQQGFGRLDWQYDLAGRKTRTAWWDGFFVDYLRDVLGNLTAVRENGAASGVGVLATYQYDSLSRRSSQTFGNGVVQNYAYDPVTRLASQITDLAATANDLTQTFSYNPASQISSVTRSNDLYAWTGHTNDNLSSTANGLNQVSNVGPKTITHDNRGNITAVGTQTYAYTSENLLSAASGGVTLYYDHLMRLVEYDTNVSTRYVYDGAAIAAEVDNPAGAIQHRYVRGDGIDEVLVHYVGGGTTNRRFLSADERGSIIATTDNAGAVLGINKYDEYGVPQSTNLGKFGYTGQAWVPELGLWYYKARFYRPDIGRFLQTDPIGYEAGTNLYAYVGNDPANATDPSGLQIEPPTPLPDIPEPSRPSETVWNPTTREWEVVVTASSWGMNDWWKGNTSPVGPDFLAARAYNLSFVNSGVSWCNKNPAQCGKKATTGKPRRNTRPKNPPPYDPRSNYCGGEGGIRLPSGNWNQACFTHDICYGTVGSTKSTCDRNLYFGVLRNCNKTHMYRSCDILAATAFLLVDQFGDEYFDPRHWKRP